MLISVSLFRLYKEDKERQVSENAETLEYIASSDDDFNGDRGRSGVFLLSFQPFRYSWFRNRLKLHIWVLSRVFFYSHY